ncbi:MAG: hypothetical protein M1839_008156 [Geoglossum umbratile]|nr:MAG: hypothetical protein M1839_008156 [Geoglossum umbratile]
MSHRTRKRPLHDSDINVDGKQPKKTLKAEPTPIERTEPKYDSLLKLDLQKECTSRGLIKSGNKPDLIARLEAADKAKRDKYANANAKNGPISKEAATKRPIGAKVPPSKSKGGPKFGKNNPQAKILARGPSGPPVFDEMGFELDYNKVAGSRRRPGCRTMSYEKYEEMLEQDRREGDRKAEIMGTEKNKISAVTLMAWDDRISRDLSIPYHLVDMEDFEEWYRRGFRAEGAEFEAKNMSEEERERLTNISIGSAFRK